jgi:3-methyl-2-oxobutanoate hydroxymethyltransferase
MMAAGANHGGGDPKGHVMPDSPELPEPGPSPAEPGPSPAEPGPWPADRRITIHDLQEATDRGARWTMLTSYDTLTAGVFEQAGVRALLVGDTSGHLVLGYPDTVPVTMDHLIPMVQAVVRGTRTALVVADLPFGSYQAGPEVALASAVRHLKEGGAQAVKLEGGRRVLPQVTTLVGAGIPVMGHLGLTPQSVNVLGGVRRVQGRGDAGEELLADALALERAGAFAVVLESVPAALGGRVAQALRIPVVGIGAGPDCDAQILVWPDMAGLTAGRLPRFVRQYADVRGSLLDAARRYTEDVAAGRYPDEAHSYA